MSAHERETICLDRYPWSTLFLYHSTTVLHFLLGATGFVIGYPESPALAWGCGAFYLVFAFGEVYLLTPLVVCPSCVYARDDGARCVSGFNILSRRLPRLHAPQELWQRSEGPLCCNNLYIGAFLLPLAGLLPALLVNPSLPLGALYLGLVASLLLRFVVFFPRVACRSCRARSQCLRAGVPGVHGPWSETPHL